MLTMIKKVVSIWNIGNYKDILSRNLIRCTNTKVWGRNSPTLINYYILFKRYCQLIREVFEYGGKKIESNICKRW